MPEAESKVTQKGEGQEPMGGDNEYLFHGGNATAGKRSKSCTRNVLVFGGVMTVTIMLLAGSLFALARYWAAENPSVSDDFDDLPFYRRSALRCGYMRFVSSSKNSTYVQPLDEVTQMGTRCIWLVYSDTKEIEVSYAQQSLDYLENSGAVVGEIDGDGLNCRKLEPGSSLIAKTPLIVSFSSESYMSMRQVRFELSPVHANGNHDKEIPGGFMTINVKEGGFPLTLTKDTIMPDFFVLFDYPAANDTGIDLRCSPIGTQCCESVATYRISPYPNPNEGSCHKLTGLNQFPGEASSNGDPLFFLFGPLKNVQNETNCELSWTPTAVESGFA